MGCQACKNSHFSEKSVLQELIKSVDAQSVTKLKQNLSKLSQARNLSIPVLLKLKIITIRSEKITILAFAFLSGSLKIVKFLIEEYNSSIVDLNQDFEELNSNPLSILCEKNHFNLLKFYLPFYYQHIMQEVTSLETNSENEGPEKMKNFKSSFTPIQIACFKGNLPIFSHLVAFNMKHPHYSLDFAHVNEETGENCALVAVRSGDLPMVKYLFEELHADFTQRNLFQENAILICACCSTKNKENDSFDGIFFYLIEVVGVDPCFNYEEVLMLLEKKNLVDYYEDVLRTSGVSVNKRDIDLNYRVKFQEGYKGTPNIDSLCVSSVGFCSGEISGNSF